MSKSLLANPLIPEAGMSDPHAIVVGDVCYLFTGHDIGFGVEDWVMPDWRIYRSNNLQSWTHVGTISPADNFMGAGSQNCWAGDVVYRNGRFYWFFSNGKRAPASWQPIMSKAPTAMPSARHWSSRSTPRFL